eukprot:232428_1
MAIKTLPQSSVKYEFHFMDSEHFSYSSKASMEFSMVKFIDKCIEKVRTESIDIVISTRDMADLVHAVLASEFDHIDGPTYLSSFITLYKPYTKLLIDTDDPINYEIINMKEDKWLSIINNPDSMESKTIISNLLTKLNGKGFIKPPAASCSSLVGDFCDMKSFTSLLNMHNKHGKIFNHYLPDFVDKYLVKSVVNDDFKQRSFSSSEISNILLVEEFMDTPIKITVDGCVVNKEIHVWGVIDSIYWSHINKNECFIGCFTPSNLSSDICNALTTKYKIYVNRLIEQYGFNNQFIDVEFFVRPKNKIGLEQCANVSNWKHLDVNDVDIKLMEINGRSFMQMTPVYRQVFEGYDGDPISTLLKIYDNQNVDGKTRFNPPKLIKNICGLNGYLSTFASGIADDLFDFEAAAQYIENGDVILAVQRGEMVNTVSQQGSLLAYANVTGRDYEHCFNKMMQIGKILVKKGAPWQEYI